MWQDLENLRKIQLGKLLQSWTTEKYGVVIDTTSNVQPI